MSKEKIQRTRGSTGFILEHTCSGGGAKCLQWKDQFPFVANGQQLLWVAREIGRVVGGSGNQ